jgi:ParB-like chromosome segregation protein Spo0J
LPPRAEPAPPQTAKAVPPAVASAASRLDDRMTALSNLVQGLRRNELSPVGEARLFLKLMTEHMASISDITIATGRTKEQVARSLRLLGLSDRLRDLIDRGALSREQAFALLDTDDPNAGAPVVPHTSGLRAP